MRVSCYASLLPWFCCEAGAAFSRYSQEQSCSRMALPVISEAAAAVFTASLSETTARWQSPDETHINAQALSVDRGSRGFIYTTKGTVYHCSHSVSTRHACQFTVEVDASGFGTVLSQRCTADEKVHPCAFFIRQLTPTEQHYGVGNRKLLALALQGW